VSTIPEGETIVKTGRDPHWRPVMMSRNTAMFTIPVDVRDAANLVGIHNEGRGAMITWDKDAQEIRVSVIDPATGEQGYEKPKPQVVVKKPKTKTKKEKAAEKKAAKEAAKAEAAEASETSPEEPAEVPTEP